MCQCVSLRFGEALAGEDANKGLKWRNKRVEWSLTASLPDPPEPFIRPSGSSCSE